METGVESIGEAVTGGLVARAVEPEAGERRWADGCCLNCRTPLVGEFCHACGQKGHVHRTLSAFGHDLLHGVLHFEGKIWRTLPMLAWHPGRLTRRYIEGERATFVSPLALFLFSVFLMFAVISAIGGPIDTGSSDTETPAEERAEARRQFAEETAEAERELKTLNAELEAAKARGESTATIEQRIAAAQLGMRLAREAYELQIRLANEAEARDAREEARSEAAEEAAAVSSNSQVSVDTSGAPEWIGWFESGYKKAKENPKLLLYKLQTNAYKFSWALIPISLPFVWLLFLHRRRYRREYKAYDHVVFITYSIAFMSLGFIVLTLLRPLPFSQTVAGFAITFIPPIHMYRQLRGAYRLSRFSALWRTFVLINVAFAASGIFLTLLLMLGMLG